MKFIICLLVSSTFVFCGINLLGNTALFQKILHTLSANEDLVYEIRGAKTKLVEECLSEVMEAVIRTESMVGPANLWIDGGRNDPRNFPRSSIVYDPEEMLDRAQYALKKAWTVELVVQNNEYILELPLDQRASTLISYREKYEPRAGDMSKNQLRRYRDCFERISASMSREQLDQARLSAPYSDTEIPTISFN